jgi:hypothetical protein
MSVALPTSLGALSGGKRKQVAHPTIKTLPPPSQAETCPECSRLFITPNRTGSCWADSITTALFYPDEPREWFVTTFIPAAETFLRMSTWDEERVKAMQAVLAEMKMLIDLYGGLLSLNSSHLACPSTSPTVEFIKHLHKAADLSGYKERWESGNRGGFIDKDFLLIMSCFQKLSVIFNIETYKHFFVRQSYAGKSFETSDATKSHQRIPLYIRTESGEFWRAASVVVANDAVNHAVCFVRCREEPWVWMMNHAQGTSSKTSSAIRFELDSINPFAAVQPELGVLLAAKKPDVPLAEYNSTSCRATILFEALSDDFPFAQLIRKELWVPELSKSAEPLFGLSDTIDAALDLATRIYWEKPQEHDLQSALRLSGLYVEGPAATSPQSPKNWRSFIKNAGYVYGRCVTDSEGKEGFEAQMGNIVFCIYVKNARNIETLLIESVETFFLLPVKSGAYLTSSFPGYTMIIKDTQLEQFVKVKSKLVPKEDWVKYDSISILQKAMLDFITIVAHYASFSTNPTNVANLKRAEKFLETLI